MIIRSKYSFNGGEEIIQNKYPALLKDIEDVIILIDAESARLKKPKGKEITRLTRIGESAFYSPPHLNALFDYYLFQRGWQLKPRVKTNDSSREGYREMDFLKEKLGVEVQFGKYSFLTYDIVAKMVIFRNLEIVDSGIEICFMSSMLPHVSSGIGGFEQVRWDLIHRGFVNNFDVPMLILGIESEKLAGVNKDNDGQQLKIFDEDVIDQRKPSIFLSRYSKLTKGTLTKIRETGLHV